jgi:ATP-dependent DNA helicase RecG
MEKVLPVGKTVYVSGRMDWFNGRPTMVHPDHIVSEEELAELPLVEPVYRLTAGLSSKVLGRAVKSALGRIPNLDEWLDQSLRTTRRWPAFGAALAQVHLPQGGDDVAPGTPERTRLAYDELLANQLALSLMREHQRRSVGRPRHGDGRITAKLRGALPFRLTQSQEAAIADITADLGRRERMLRLLQGDVGSGKTVVALFAAATAIEAGGRPRSWPQPSFWCGNMRGQLPRSPKPPASP